jgi:hypothetical protein
MTFRFEWNPYADQPHNVAPRSERFRHHLRHASSYFAIAGANLRRAAPILRRYRNLMRSMYGAPVPIPRSVFGCAVSPAAGRDDRVFSLLAETGATETLVRVPSWEKKDMARVEAFVRELRSRGFGVVIALLQRRDDVLDPGGWRAFLEEAFGRLSAPGAVFEIGHAWNRTKWGVWDHREYVRLAEPAFELAPRFGVRLAGPAVIDFEFHLYPVTLPRLPFDKITSLLYVDRMGAPENAQFGWTATRKLALLKAVVDASARASRDLWITEVNWPLAGTGPYSPASGKPNVSEEEQADYLVRYFVPGLASGLVEKIYWWQLAAPGYGLLDTREEPWRKRPSFAAFRHLLSRLEGSLFEGRDPDETVEIFRFRKEGRAFAVAWSAGEPVERVFHQPVEAVFDRNGREMDPAARKILIQGSPKYVLFRE